MTNVRCAILPALLAGLFWLGAVGAAADEAVFPDAEWAVIASPAEAGYDALKLKALDAHVDSLNTHSVIAIVGGRVLYTFGDTSEVSYLASVRKSILAMLYGKFVKNGSIDLDRTLEDIGMDDIGGLLPIERRATIRDLISARSGIYHPASNSGDSTADAPARGSQEPGTYFLYNNWDFNASGGAFERLSGRSIFGELYDQLVIPLGFQDFDLGRHRMQGDGTRSQYMAYHMHISTRDLARIGYLMLRQGRWRDSTIIDPDWVTEMTTETTDTSEMNPESSKNAGFDYGYMWWLMDEGMSPDVYKGAYAGRGHFGQYLMVVPALDMVVSHKTWPVNYQTPEEYEEIRTTWDQFIGIVDRLVEARQD